jgi:DNA-binding response OmpR family regulator
MTPAHAQRNASDMTLTKPVVLGVDEDRAAQSAIAQVFNQQGVTYRFVTDRRKVVSGAKQLEADLLVVFGELASDFVIQVLDSLSQDVSASSRPVVVVCEDVADASFVQGFRTGVVLLVGTPFTLQEVEAVRGLWAELPSRPGVVSGSGDGRAILRLVDHVRRTRRSGQLVASPRTPNEGRASFVNGRLERARFLATTGPEALRAMGGLPVVSWTFSEVAGQQGEGANVVIEVGGSDHGETSLADVVVGIDEGEPRPSPDEPLAFEVQPAPEGPAPLPAPQAPRTRMLFVDDDETILRLFSTLFSKHGFEVTTASDGQQGAEVALQGDFDLIFADLNMPRLDGWGLLRLLRDDLRTRELPVAFISAHDDYRESLKALDAGAQAYVSKGTRLEAIVAQARALLEPREKARAVVASTEPFSLQIHTVGPQWLLHQLAGQRRTGTLTAKDGWASYRLVFQAGTCVHASAVAGKYTAEGERAFNAFIGTRAAVGEFGPSDPGGAPRNLFLTTDVLVERACTTLNENERRARESLMVSATQIDVNEQLYAVYRQVGPKQWLECARLICEERVAPREILARLDTSPVEIEETMKDLVRRGVVTLKKAP